MSEIPLIIGVKRRLPLTGGNGPIVVFEVETIDGPLLLQLTQSAAHELNALIDEMRPSATPILRVKLSG
jgi:hypothetical protein